MSRNVVFNEDVFPFETRLEESPTMSICPPLPTLDNEVANDYSVPNIVERESSSVELPTNEVSSPSPELELGSPLNLIDQTPIVSPEDIPATVNSSPAVVDPSDMLGRGKREKTKSVLLKEYVTYHSRFKIHHTPRFFQQPVLQVRLTLLLIISFLIISLQHIAFF